MTAHAAQRSVAGQPTIGSNGFELKHSPFGKLASLRRTMMQRHDRPDPAKCVVPADHTSVGSGERFRGYED